MEKNYFVTETDEKIGKQLSYKGLIIAFSLFSLLACLGFLITWKTFLFFEGIVLFAISCTFFQNRKKSYAYKLEFQNNLLKIVELKEDNTIFLSAVSVSDILISQSKRDMQKDYCGIMIKDTTLVFVGVKKYKQLKAYIQENCLE